MRMSGTGPPQAQHNYNQASSSFSSFPAGPAYDNTGGRMFSTNRAPVPPPRNQNYVYPPSMYNRPVAYGTNFNPLYSGFPSYSSYRPSYMSPGIGTPAILESSFIEEAQESSREAFSSIESIVNAFGSINMMIESTYYALQSSFNAVLSVAENFSRLKFQFGQILSALTLIRTFQWLYRKLFYLLGLRKHDPATESAWNAASQSVEEPVTGNSSRRSWPMIMFFIAVYAGPFLMWKFINSVMQRTKTKDNWANKNGDYYYAIAKYNYKAQSPDELSFSMGDRLRLAPYEKQVDKSWPLAHNGRRSGIVPINYLEIKFKSSQSVESDCPPKSLVTTSQNQQHSETSHKSELLKDLEQGISEPLCAIPSVHDSSKVPAGGSSACQSSEDLSDHVDELSQEFCKLVNDRCKEITEEIINTHS